MRRFFIIINIVILQVNFYKWLFMGFIIKLRIDMQKGILCMVYKKRGIKMLTEKDKTLKIKFIYINLCKQVKKPQIRLYSGFVIFYYARKYFRANT